jgi:hypothetical protein
MNTSYSIESFVYLAHIIGNFTASFVWWQAAYQIGYILFQCVAVSIKFLLTVFKEGARNGFFWLTDTYYT